jgi:hypothetical protein
MTRKESINLRSLVMKKIEANIKPHKPGEVKDALGELGIAGISALIYE